MLEQSASIAGEARIKRRLRSLLARGFATSLIAAAFSLNPFFPAHADPQADLAVGVHGSSDPVGSGQNVTYTVTVRNLSATTTASTVTVDDVLAAKSGTMVAGIVPVQPAYVWASSTSQGTCTFPADPPTQSYNPPQARFDIQIQKRLHCDLGEVAGGGTVTVTVEATAFTNTFVVVTPEEIVLDGAVVQSATSDPNLENNIAFVTTTVTAS